MKRGAEVAHSSSTLLGRTASQGGPSLCYVGAAHVHARDSLHNGRLAVGHMANGACTERAGGVSSLRVSELAELERWGCGLQQERAKGTSRTADSSGLGRRLLLPERRCTGGAAAHRC